MDNELRRALHDPEQLETLYRRRPDDFTRAFGAVAESVEDTPLLRYWKIRLRHEPAAVLPARTNPMLHWYVLLLCLLAGTAAKLPDFLNFARPEEFYFRNAGVIVFASLAAYFLLTRQVSRRIIAVTAVIFAAATIYINWLPLGLQPFQERSDTALLALLHLPLFLWTIAGLVFIGRWLKDAAARIEYLKFNGEHAIYALLLMLGGQLLTVLTVGLFSAIQVDIFDWYLHWGVVFGATAVPIVGAHLAWTRAKTSVRISPLIAKIFSPLVLVTLIAYLTTAAVQGKSPFTDREFLVLFNAVLLAVLAISVFTLTEHTAPTRNRWSRLTLLGLLVCGLAVDAVALSAIAFRLSSFGLTPNRVAVLGANLLIFANTAGLLWYYVQDWRAGADSTRALAWTAKFLPVYTAWTAFITFLFPVLYQFR